MNRSAGRNRIILILILLFSAGFRVATLNQPFQRDAEGCGAFFGLLARNYFRYDFSTSLGVPVMSMGDGAGPIFYANHPPTTPLLIAGVYAMTGYGGQYEWIPADWQIRLPTGIFTLACIWLIHMLVLSRAGPRAALLAAAIFAVIPMTLVYGGLPDVINPQLVFFALLTVAAYEQFWQRPGGWRFALLMLGYAGAALMDWPAMFLLPVLGVHFVLTRPMGQWPWIVGFGVCGMILFAALYAHLTTGQPDWGWMARQVQHRTGSAGDNAAAFSLADWVRHAIWEKAIARHTVIVSLLGLLWVAMATSRRFSGGADRLTGLLLAWAFIHITIGRQGVYQHEWWWWPLTPGLVIAAALAADELLTLVQERMKLPVMSINSAVVAALLLLAGWNLRAFTIERRSAPALDYSLVEFGEAIRRSAPGDSAVMVAEDDMSMAFWHYADRAVIRHVWDMETFQRRRGEGIVDVTFDYYERWYGKVGAMVVPKAFVPNVKQPLLEYLDSNHPRREAGKFIIWNLSEARPAQN